MTLAILEGSRRQESGDAAAAWDNYRSVLQMITHCRRRGSTVQHYTGRRANRWLQHGLTNWAADPKTTIAQLHVALDEVLKNEPNPDWSIAAIKSGYVELMQAIERPMPLSAQQELEGEWTLRLGDMALSPAMVDHIEAARRCLLREPERSRRSAAATLRQLPGACGGARAAAARAGCLGEVLVPDLNEPDQNGQDQRAALPRQRGSTGGGPSATA